MGEGLQSKKVRLCAKLLMGCHTQQLCRTLLGGLTGTGWAWVKKYY